MTTCSAKYGGPLRRHMALEGQWKDLADAVRSCAPALDRRMLRSWTRGLRAIRKDGQRTGDQDYAGSLELDHLPAGIKEKTQ